MKHRQSVWRRGLTACALVLSALAAHAGTPGTAAMRWLVVGASHTSAQALVRQAARLDPRSEGLVLSTADCGDPKPVFAWALNRATSLDSARTALAALRARVPDAFIKACRVRPASLLALGLPAIHPSIQQVSESAVNWDDADRVSSAVGLAGGAVVVLQRYHDATPDDPLEGRRVRVLLVRGDAAPVVLSGACHGARDVVSNTRWLAFACQTEQAADNLLHEVRAFDMAGAAAATVPRCRQPQLGNTNNLRCMAEEVSADGHLRLRARSVRLPALKS